MGIVKKIRGKQFLRFILLFLLSVTACRAQTPGVAAPGQEQGAPPATGQRTGPNEGRGQPLFGKITAINKGSMELAKPDGSTAIVKLTDKTEYRKDRQGARLGDFKVGELVFVRGEENADHSMTAQLIGGRSGGGAEGRGTGGVIGGFIGVMGKDYIAGEVKSIDAPQITVLRSDNVTQRLELNEETSLRKGRESVTMADIQPGDHVFVRGALQNNVFVPKIVLVIAPEQWKRMEEIRMNPDGNKPTGEPKTNPPQQ